VRNTLCYTVLILANKVEIRNLFPLLIRARATYLTGGTILRFLMCSNKLD